jgi:hypothetical protein
MNIIKTVSVAALLAALLQSCALVEEYGTVACGGSHRLQVVDLRMSPDPIAEGQRIDRWLVRLRADASGECRTMIRLREEDSNDLIGQERVYLLRPGMNDIVIEPSERYRFSRNEHCFMVAANIEGTAKRVDATRRFCAKQSGGRRWTMK